MAETNASLVKLSVYRFDPQRDAETRYQDYEVPKTEGLSVMAALNYIYENIDPSLSFYFSCRVGLCDGCDALVNGEVKLTCNTVIEGDTKIEPLPDYVLVKDLVVDKNRPKQAFRKTDKLFGLKRR
jgi:fumarate reductase iron-sulfur subunit